MSDCCRGNDPEPEKSCCGGKKEEPATTSCRGGGGDPPKEEDSCCGGGGRIDWLLWGSLALVAAGIAGHFIGAGPGWWQTFAHGSWELMTKAWWGILIGLIGLKWTLLFIALSMVIGVVSGIVADALVKRGALPANRHSVELDGDYRLRDGLREVWGNIRPGGGKGRQMVRDGFVESRMILRWIFFGFAMAAAVRAFVPTEVFNQYFGPTLLGLGLTLVATTVIEVCSEGSSPIAADLLSRAGAPGNAFTFLMAGAATDYTEIMALRETTKSWKATLALPLITTPQVLVISWLLNQAGP